MSLQDGGQVGEKLVGFHLEEVESNFNSLAFATVSVFSVETLWGPMFRLLMFLCFLSDQAVYFAAIAEQNSGN